MANKLDYLTEWGKVIQISTVIRKSTESDEDELEIYSLTDRGYLLEWSFYHGSWRVM